MDHQLQTVFCRSVYQRDFCIQNNSTASPSTIGTALGKDSSRYSIIPPAESPANERKEENVNNNNLFIPHQLRTPLGRYSCNQNKVQAKAGIIPNAISESHLNMKTRSTYEEEVSQKVAQTSTETLPRFLVGRHLKVEALREAVAQSDGFKKESLNRVLEAVEERDRRLEEYKKSCPPRWITRWPGPLY